MPDGRSRRIDELTVVDLGELDRRHLAAIVRNIAAFTDATPSERTAIRWAIREMAATLRSGGWPKTPPPE